jgi:ADP-heptose:LPS heptosyltransferase
MIEDPFQPSDCRQFTGYRPCAPGRLCASCGDYDPVQGEVLIINLGALGDVLRTTAQLPSLRAAWPGARISWLTSPRAVPLLEGHPLLDRVIPMGLEAICELESRQFDLLLCVDKERAACVMATRMKAWAKRGFLLDAHGVIVPANPQAAYLYRTGLDDELKFRRNDRSEPAMLAEALCLRWDREPYRIHLAEAELIGEPVAVGFNTGASSGWPRKSLVPELQAQAIRLIHEATGEPILLLGGPEDSERNAALARELGSLVELSPCDTGLRDGAAQVARCRVVFSGDSLGMHLAIATGCYVVAWFGPTCPQEIDLFDRGIKLLSPVGCAPCWEPGCQRSPACHGALSPELVRDAVLDSLDAQAAQRPLDEVRGGSWWRPRAAAR